MTIPSKEVFDSFANESKWVLKDEWSSLLSYRKSALTRVEISKLLYGVKEVRDHFYSEINKHELVTFFEGQANWDRACKAMFPHTRRKKIDFDYKSHHKRLLDRFMESRRYFIERGRDEVEANVHLRGEVKRYIEENPAELWVSIFEAFSAYYHTDKWEKIVHLIPNAKHTIEMTYKALSDLFEFAELDNIKGGGYYKVFQNKSAVRFRDQLDEVLHDEKYFNFPVKRNDETLKERGLVYDLSRVMHRRFREYKPAAIFYLLGMEGISNPLDLRSIERLLAQWRPTYKSSKGLIV